MSGAVVQQTLHYAGFGTPPHPSLKLVSPNKDSALSNFNDRLIAKQLTSLNVWLYGVFTVYTDAFNNTNSGAAAPFCCD